jgi:tRNA nucleotidyltransferase/poly(A) polymerase
MMWVWHAPGTNTVLRCAGGWVRDKLLGCDSLDIDIALDNMLGKDFAEKV